MDRTPTRPFCDDRHAQTLLPDFAVCGTLRAQETIAPTPEAVGIARGGDFANYNIVDSFELGYRWRATGGSVDTIAVTSITATASACWRPT